MNWKGNMGTVPVFKISVSEKFLFLARKYGQYVTKAGFSLLRETNNWRK